MRTRPFIDTSAGRQDTRFTMRSLSHPCVFAQSSPEARRLKRTTDSQPRRAAHRTLRVVVPRLTTLRQPACDVAGLVAVDMIALGSGSASPTSATSRARSLKLFSERTGDCLWGTAQSVVPQGCYRGLGRRACLELGMSEVCLQGWTRTEAEICLGYARSHHQGTMVYVR
jgi:hypothetical protein